MRIQRRADLHGGSGVADHVAQAWPGDRRGLWLYGLPLGSDARCIELELFDRVLATILIRTESAMRTDDARRAARPNDRELLPTFDARRTRRWIQRSPFGRELLGKRLIGH